MEDNSGWEAKAIKNTQEHLKRAEDFVNMICWWSSGSPAESSSVGFFKTGQGIAR